MDETIVNKPSDDGDAPENTAGDGEVPKSDGRAGFWKRLRRGSRATGEADSASAVTNADDADETILAAPAADGDATLVMAPSRGAGPASDDDATLIMQAPTAAPASEAPGPVGHGAGADDDATVIMSTAASAPLALDDDTTMIADVVDVAAPAADDDTVIMQATPASEAHEISSAHDAAVDDATVIAGSADAVPSVSAPVSEVAAEPASPPDSIDEQVAESEPTLVVAPTDAGGQVDASGLPGLFRELVDAGLMTERKASNLAVRAIEQGHTAFSVINGDETVTNRPDIYAWSAAYLGCEYHEDPSDLLGQTRAVPWLTAAMAERKGVLMLAPNGSGKARYATCDPFDIKLRDWVRRYEGLAAEPVLVSRSSLSQLIRLQHGEDEGSEDVLIHIVDFDDQEAEEARASLQDQDVPMIVDYLLMRGHVQGASDIHVEPTEHGLIVRNRVDGILHQEIELPLLLHREVASRIKILSGMDVAEKRRPQDGRISIRLKSRPFDVRVSSFPTVHGEKLVMRLLDQDSLMPSPEHLGLNERDLRTLIDKITAPYGLIMLCGPTGSGKTTTLYSCLGAIDKQKKNVLTIEDPVEYRLDGVHQMQVNHKIGLTFAAGLRNILRQDPDVVMVGECRDLETAGMAIQASLTGHIVFSTIHTNDAVGVVSRLLDMDIDRFLVASALTLAIAQRLVRTICKHCRSFVDGKDVLARLHAEGVSDEKMRYLGIDIDPDIPYAVGRGCAHCRNTGYSGRRPVFEVFEMTNECRALVMSDAFGSDRLRDLARSSGMQTLVQHGLQLVDQQETTHEEVIRVLGESN